MKQNFQLIYLVYLLVFLYYLTFSFSWLLLLPFILSIALAFYRGYYILLLLLVCFMMFFYIVKQKEEKRENSRVEKIYKIKPYIDTLEINGDRLSFRGVEAGQKYQIFYKFKSQKEQDFFKTIDFNFQLYFEGELERPESQRNFSGFDYKSYLKNQGIHHLIKIENIQEIKPLSAFDLPLLRRRAILWARKHFPAPMSSYMTGLLFGWLEKDFEEMGDIYTSLGIIHLFALSGMHVNFFMALLRKVLLRLGVTQERLPFIQIPFSIFYAFMTGLSVSVLRALLQKNIPLRNSIDKFSITFILLLLFMPKFLLTTGGQLSMIYAFLLAFLSGKVRSSAGIKKSLVEAIVLSLGVLPLLIFHFHSFQPLSILLTLFFSLIFNFLLLPGLLAIYMLSFLGIHLTFFNPLFYFLEEVIKVVANVFQYPFIFGKPDLLLLLLLFACSGLMIDFYRKKKWNVLLMALLFSLFYLVKNSPQASITMLDVGQGDSILLQDKWNRRNILIDTGGRLMFPREEDWQHSIYKSNAETTLIPYLKSQGIGSIDSLILTHPDADHVGDLKILSQKINIKNIYTSKTALENKDFGEKLSKIKSKVRIAQTGDKLPIFDDYLYFLSTGFAGGSNNNNSLVTFGDFYGKKFLFTGDLEEEGEKHLEKAYPRLRTDVLKVGHHGSNTSSKKAFLQSLQPEFALISVGKNNRYKHPSEETLDNLASENIKVYRTDYHGAIRFVEEKSSWKLQTVK